MNPYKENGQENRKAYLDSLAEQYSDDVYMIAELLGESEDFDGLIVALEDSVDWE